MNAKPYSERFLTDEEVNTYEYKYANPTSYDNVLWNVERQQLKSLLAQFRLSHERIDYLDFASGTGRVIAFVEQFVDRSTAIEISPAAIEMAKRKTRRTMFVCRDITAPEAGIEGAYDLITSFRFLVNAEPSLRLAGLKALASRLKDESSWLIFNNHCNLLSYRALSWPVHRLHSMLKREKSGGENLTTWEVEQMADQAGLRIILALGCGFLSTRSVRLLSPQFVRRIEERLSQLQFLSRFGINQMYVAALKSKPRLN